MGAWRARPRASTLQCYRRLAAAALSETGELKPSVRQWARRSRMMLKTALNRLGHEHLAQKVKITTRWAT